MWQSCFNGNVVGKSNALRQTSQGCTVSLCRKRPQFTSKWIAGLTGKELETEIAALSSEQMTALLTTLKPHLAAELLQVIFPQWRDSSILMPAPVSYLVVKDKMLQ